MSGALRTLFDLLVHHVERGADRPLLVTPEGTVSSGDVERASARVAGWLRRGGLAPGDRVVVDLKNGVEAVAALFGIARAGGVVVGATPQWSAPQLEHVVGDAGARFLITNASRVRQLGAGRPEHLLVVTEGAPAPAAAGVTAWGDLAETWSDHASPDPAAPAMLIYTSGTTGRPKGVVHPHRNLVDFARIVTGYLENDEHDRLLWVLGWSFGYGLSQLLSMCVAGGRLVLPASMLAADVVAAHEAHRATGLAQVPYGWAQLVSFVEKTGRRLEGLRYVTNAGDGPSPALLERLPPALPGARIILMYGQTECLRTTWLPADRFGDKRGAMGYPIPEVDVYVVTERGTIAGVDEPGELLHRGALLSPGYWRAPDATAHKFRPHPALRDVVGDEPVLHTGDVVRRDADGCLWYVGRSERMIKSSGFRFGPGEIEAVVHALPGVRDVVAFGVDDPALGQVVEVAVVVDAVAGEGGAPDADRPSPDEAAILLALRQRLPRYMVPRRIHLVDAIPRTPNGKVSLPALRSLAG